MGYFFTSRTTFKQFKRDVVSSASVRDKLLAGIETSGTEREGKALKRVLRDIDRFNKARKQESKQLAMINLMESSVQFWAIGKIEQRMETEARFSKVLEEKLSTKKRPYDYRAEKLRIVANMLCEESSKERDAKAKWNKKYKGRNAFAFSKKDITKSLSFNDAMKKANDITKLLSPKEFDAKEVELQNSFKTWRARKR